MNFVGGIRRTTHPAEGMIFIILTLHINFIYFVFLMCTLTKAAIRVNLKNNNIGNFLTNG